MHSNALQMRCKCVQMHRISCKTFALRCEHVVNELRTLSERVAKALQVQFNLQRAANTFERILTDSIAFKSPASPLCTSTMLQADYKHWYFIDSRDKNEK